MRKLENFLEDLVMLIIPILLVVIAFNLVSWIFGDITKEVAHVVEFEVIERVENTPPDDLPKPPTNLGKFKVTFYCAEPHHHICNNGDSSVTATGTTPTPNRTIAVDPNVIPLGSAIAINGIVYYAEDTGGAIKGNRIDILVETHQEALEKGIKEDVEVLLINGGN